MEEQSIKSPSDPHAELISQRELKAKKLYNPALGDLNDFRNFLFLVWEFLKLPPPTKAQYLLAYQLQHGSNRQIIQAFRGVGKSYVTVSFCVWLWLIDPQFQILVISQAEEKAKEFAHLVKQIIEGMELCKHLSPSRSQSGMARNSVLSFDVGPATPKKDPSLSVSGITGQITGGRADFIIPDDVETVDNSATPLQRQKLLDKVNEFIAIIKPEPWTSVYYLGTPQTINSIYYDLAYNRGYDLWIYPAEYPEDIEAYKGNLAPNIVQELIDNPGLVGEPTDPQRFTYEVLREKESNSTKAYYKLQYQLDPALSDADKYPLKLKDFIVLPSIDPRVAPISLAWGNSPQNRLKDKDIPSVGINNDGYYAPIFCSDKWEPYTMKRLIIDPSGRGADETAYCVLKELNGMIYIAEWGGTTRGYDQETLLSLATIAKKHEVNEVVIESNFGDGMFSTLLGQVLARVYPVAIEEVRSSTQKERRICDTLEPVLGTHRLVISEELIKSDYTDKGVERSGFWQLTRITRDKRSLTHDDRIDVLAIGVARFVESMMVDPESVEQKYMEDMRQQEFEKFLRKFDKNYVGETTWVDSSHSSGGWCV